MHQPIDQGTHFTSTQRDEFLSSGTGMASYPMSSSSASLGHRHSGVESASGGDGRFNAPSEREHDMQSIPRLGDFDYPVPDKPAAPTESSRPKYTSESASSVLLHFGLETEDLDYLISFPDDQITPANLPFILRQIRIEKAKRAATAVQSKPCPEPQPARSVSGMDSHSLSSSGGVRMHQVEMSSTVLQPSKVIDYGHTGKYTGGIRDEIGRTSGSRANCGGTMLLMDTYDSNRHSREPLQKTTTEVKSSAFGSSHDQVSSEPLKEPEADRQSTSNTQPPSTLCCGVDRSRPGLVVIGSDDASGTKDQIKTPGQGSTVTEQMKKQQTQQQQPMQKEQMQKDQMQKDQIQKDQMQKVQIQKDKMQKDQMQKDQIQKDQTQKQQMQKEQTQKDQMQKDQIQKDQTQKQQMQKDQTQKQQMQKDQMQKHQMQKQQMQKDPIQKDQIQKDQMQKQQMQKQQMQKDPIQKDQMQKQQMQKDQMQKQQMQKDQMQKQQKQKDQIQKDQMQKQQMQKGQMQKQPTQQQSKQQTQKQPTQPIGQAMRSLVCSVVKSFPPSITGATQRPGGPRSVILRPALRPAKDLPRVAMMHDYAGATPRIFPQNCSLCNITCVHMKEWVSHQNSRFHLESCKLLRKQYPEWDGEIALEPGAAGKDDEPSTSLQTYQQHQTVRHRCRSCSRSRSPSPRRHHGSEGRREKWRSRSRSPHSSRYTRTNTQPPSTLYRGLHRSRPDLMLIGSNDTSDTEYESETRGEVAEQMNKQQTQKEQMQQQSKQQRQPVLQMGWGASRSPVFSAAKSVPSASHIPSITVAVQHPGGPRLIVIPPALPQPVPDLMDLIHPTLPPSNRQPPAKVEVSKGFHSPPDCEITKYVPASPRTSDERRSPPRRTAETQLSPRRTAETRLSPKRSDPRRSPPRRSDNSRSPPRRTAEKRSPPRRSDPRRSLPRRLDERRSPPRRSDERRSPPRRTDERRSPPRRSVQLRSPQRKESSSAETLANKLLETSAVQSLSDQCGLEDLFKILAPALLAELDKMKSSSSSSSSSSHPRRC
ncbi:zinc finger protein 638 isoform X9 [Sebastes umbrosus]|uniref:zinc finger protein 638 isoform X9 n=1 Tax=Sebastes umbrosus TaxID=72105 RepID=UPI0018A03D19|nr:zinc finger protein 638 isoform X9 [Sebastes umbrosus]